MNNSKIIFSPIPSPDPRAHAPEALEFKRNEDGSLSKQFVSNRSNLSVESHLWPLLFTTDELEKNSQKNSSPEASKPPTQPPAVPPKRKREEDEFFWRDTPATTSERVRSYVRFLEYANDFALAALQIEDAERRTEVEMEIWMKRIRLANNFDIDLKTVGQIRSMDAKLDEAEARMYEKAKHFSAKQEAKDDFRKEILPAAPVGGFVKASAIHDKNLKKGQASETSSMLKFETVDLTTDDSSDEDEEEFVSPDEEKRCRDMEKRLNEIKSEIEKETRIYLRRKALHQGSPCKGWRPDLELCVCTEAFHDQPETILIEEMSPKKRITRKQADLDSAELFALIRKKHTPDQRAFQKK